MPYKVELCAPDIGAYRGGERGVEYVTTFASGKAGPHVMVSALTHGNEICGAIALDFLFKQEIRPRCGTLSLAFVNTAAYARFDPRAPLISRFVDEDFNRLWDEQTLSGERDSVELRRARELRPIIDEVDYLLDVHSMQQENVPLMLCGEQAKGRQLALALGAPEHIVADPGHASGKRMRDYADFARPNSHKTALLVECGQHWTAPTADVALNVVLRFLNEFNMIEPDFYKEHRTAADYDQRVISVTGPYTMRSNNFRFVKAFKGMEVIPDAGTVIGWDGDQEVRTPFDGCVLIMPSRRSLAGESAVRFGRYVEHC